MPLVHAGTVSQSTEAKVFVRLETLLVAVVNTGASSISSASKVRVIVPDIDAVPVKLRVWGVDPMAVLGNASLIPACAPVSEPPVTLAVNVRLSDRFASVAVMSKAIESPMLIVDV